MQVSVIVAMLAAIAVSETPVEELASMGLGPAGLAAGPTMILMAGTLLVWWSMMRVSANLLLGKMRRAGWYSRKGWRWPGRTDLVCQTASLVLFVFLLTAGGWAGLIDKELRDRHLAGLWELLLVSPFLILTILKWYSFYPVNRYIREYIVVGQLAEGLSARPVWSQAEYLSFHIRNGLLIILAPMLAIFTIRDVLMLVLERYYPDWSGSGVAIEAGTFAGAIAIFILSPFMLRYIWKTRPLPVGPLREKLEQLCERLKLRARDILLWDTSGAVANAAVMGIVRPVRYVLLTDSLVENMQDGQIEAVFGHEAGHVRHHHIFFLVLFVIASMGAGSLLLDAGDYAAKAWLNGREISVGHIEWLLGAASAGALAGWFLLFGWVSRRFERQADVFSAMSCQPDNEPQQDELSPEAANIMAAALERVAMLNGMAVEARSWRHSSIASRMVFLREIADHRKGLKVFLRKIKYMKGVILLAAFMTVAIFLMQLS
jgi:STE24 endopeptidase